jgi:hypothetical protein
MSQSSVSTIVSNIHLRETHEGQHTIKELRNLPYAMKTVIIDKMKEKNVIFYAYMNLLNYNLPGKYILHVLQSIARDSYTKYFTNLANMYNVYIVIYNKHTKCITIWSDNENKIESLINYLKLCFKEEKELYKRELCASTLD